jgi:spore germination cell wall hydrolase CwlJ-like protein
MRWFQALAALLVYLWLAFGAFMATVHFSYPAVGGDLRRGELEIMVRIVQAEATGEPAIGAKAVAWTMLNRLRAGTYGKTLTRIMLAPHQYASPAPLDDSSDAYLKAMHATVSALLGVGGDPTGGSTHFARCDLRPQPLWMRTFERRAVHGTHCFFRKRY